MRPTRNPKSEPYFDLEKAWFEEPIDEKFYPVIDTDLARDNLENDLPAADLADL